MKRLLILAPIALAACHSKPTTVADNASASQVDAALAAKGEGLSLSPGQWTMTATFKDVSAPNMPPQALAMVRQQMLGHPVTSQTCLTPEQAKQPAGSFFTPGAGANCKYDHFAMSGGKIDSVMSCSAPNGATQHMMMKGTYGADAMHFDMTTSGSGGAGMPGQNMTVVMAIDGKHAGACGAGAGKS